VTKQNIKKTKKLSNIKHLFSPRLSDVGADGGGGGGCRVRVPFYTYIYIRRVLWGLFNF